MVPDSPGVPGPLGVLLSPRWPPPTSVVSGVPTREEILSETQHEPVTNTRHDDHQTNCPSPHASGLHRAEQVRAHRRPGDGDQLHDGQLGVPALQHDQQHPGGRRETRPLVQAGQADSSVQP